MKHKIFEKYRFQLGRLLSGSKSAYRIAYPNNEIYFNANVFAKDGKIWYGDLDLTKDIDKLQKIANELKENLYVLREHDGRFQNEKLPFKDIKKIAVRIIKHEKK